MPKGFFQRPADIGARISEGKRPGAVAEKRRVRKLYLDGSTPKVIAELTGVPYSTVKNWIVELPKHSTGFSQRHLGSNAARVARLTGRDGEVIRLEMESKENDPCVFCQGDTFEQKGHRRGVFHHYADGRVDRAHGGCNLISAHAS